MTFLIFVELLKSQPESSSVRRVDMPQCPPTGLLPPETPRLNGPLDQVLIVNLGQSYPRLPAAGPERKRQLIEAASGAWSPYHARSQTPTLFDPDRVGVIMGVHRGRTRVVLDVVPDPRCSEHHRWHWDAAQPRRIRFAAECSRRFAHLEGEPALRTWRQGQQRPVQTIPLSELTVGNVDAAPQAEAPSTQRAVLGEVEVTSSPNHGVHISLPAGVPLTLQVRPPHYYTPTSLIEELVELLLGGLPPGAAVSPVHDPAAGSGGFLAQAHAHFVFRSAIDVTIGQVKSHVIERLKIPEVQQALADKVAEHWKASA